MPTDLSAEQRTRTVRAFLKLCLASSILQSAVNLTIYWFHLSLRASYLLTLVPIAPLCAALVGAVRKRAAETDPYVRKAYANGTVVAGIMIVMSAVLFTPGKGGDLFSAINDSAMPLVPGVVFAFMLLLPKTSVWGAGNLGDFLLPLRNRLATPTQNRMSRTAALLFVYIAFSFASRVLFDNYTLTGVLAYVVALLPVLPLFGFVPIYNKYMAEEQDEFQRHLYHQSILIAFFGTFVIASVISHLQDHALISQRSSHLYRPYSVYQIFSWLVSEPFRPYSVFYIFLFLQFETVHILMWLQALRIRAQEKQEKKAR